MSVLDTPEPPRVTLTKRYNDPMDGCDSKIFGRLASTRNREENGIAVPFREEESQRYSPKISIAESVMDEAKGDGVGLIFLYHTGTGTVYEYDVSDFSEKPYKEEWGDERFQHPRGLRGAKYRWFEIGPSFFTNDSFSYP